MIQIDSDSAPWIVECYLDAKEAYKGTMATEDNIRVHVIIRASFRGWTITSKDIDQAINFCALFPLAGRYTTRR
jgi:hypothetical protein